MKKSLFGDRIPCSCSYCMHAAEQEGECVCTKKQSIRPDGNCSHFHYNPLKRVPRPAPKLPHYTPDDFSL